MLTRTQATTLAFRCPSRLKSAGGLQPAGAYRVEAGKELPGGSSFPAHRRVSTTITRQTVRAGALVQALPVDPRGLAEAHAADRP